jgi:hypothetical protein
MIDTKVQLYGQIRDAAKYVDSFNEFLGTKSDVYISTWGPNDIRTRDGSHIQDSMTFDELYYKYKPKFLELERFNNPRTFNVLSPKAYDGTIADETVAQNVYYMFYKMYRVNKLSRSYFGKRVIRTRMDIEFVEPFPDIYPDYNEVYIPEGFDHRGGYNDLLCIADNYTMNTIGNFFRFVESKILSLEYHPESMFRTFLEVEGLTVKRFPLKYKFKGALI